MSKREMRLEAIIKRNYGKHEVSFGISEIMTINNGAHRRTCFNNLVEQLEDQISCYEQAHLHHVQVPQDNSVLQNTNTTELVPLQLLMVENVNGQRRMSAKGGKYSKFGVAIYTDTCITDLDLEAYEYGAHVMDGKDMKFLVDIDNGKPKRVLSIS